MSFTQGPEFAKLLRDLGVSRGFSLAPPAPAQTERERRIQALIDRPGTPGELAAAQAAMDRIHGDYNEIDSLGDHEYEDDHDGFEFE